MGRLAQDFSTMRKKYARFVELSNKGARELGIQRYRGHVAGQL